MAILQPPILPSRLHRYRSLTRSPDAIDQEIDTICHNYIFCSEFSRMNDPMEGFFRSSKLLRGDVRYRGILRSITDSKSNAGIACFSETYDNVLMWSHYAGNYSGICIAYSGSELKGGLSDHFSLVRLAYVDEPPVIFPSHARNTDNAAVRILSQKKYNWAYEREWRILASVGHVSLGNAKAIKAIRLGSRIASDHRKAILEAIRGTKIEVWAMTIDGYDHEWEQVDVPTAPKKKKSAGKKGLKKAKS
jgi:hypothetical protein